MQIVLHYYLPGHGSVEELHSTVDQLFDRMDELRRIFSPRVKMPFSVDLVKKEDPDSPCTEYCEHLSVGMGNGDWLIFFWPGYEKGPMLYSFGDEDSKGTMEFFFGDATAMSRKYVISRELAMDAVKVWFEQGVLSNSVRWTTKIFPAM